MLSTMKGESASKSLDGPSIDKEWISRTVLVTSLPQSANTKDLTIYFQSRKNGGGDIQEINLENGSAVITFEEEKVAKSVLKKKQVLNDVLLTVEPYIPLEEELKDFEVFFEVSAKIHQKELNHTMAETDDLLDKIREKTKVEVVKPQSGNTDVFILLGSFQQIDTSRRLLQSFLSKDSMGGKKCTNIEEVTTSSALEIMPKTNQNGNDDEGRHMNGVDLDEIGNNAKSERLKLQGTFVTPSEFSLDKEEKVSNHTEGVSSRDLAKSQDPTNVKPIRRNRSLEKTKVTSPGPSLPAAVKDMSERDLKPFSPDEGGSKDSASRAIKVTYMGSTSSEEKTMDCTQKIEISNKEWQVFVKMNEAELQSIMSQLSVQIEPEDNTSVAVIKPSRESNKENLKLAARKVNDLYEGAKRKMRSIRFALADPENKEDNKKLRTTILEIRKSLPVVLERAADRQSWEIFGETCQVEKGLKLLERSVKLQSKEQKVDDERVEESDSEEETEKETDTTSDCHDDEEDDKDCHGKLEHFLGNVKLSVYKGDITEEDCDAIVNAANERLEHGSGVARDIVSKGGSSIQHECRRVVQSHGKLKVGEATFSQAGKLRCKMIIHAVGPNWREEKGEKSKALLKKACKESLTQAHKYGFKSIAFPAISSGIFGMPKSICAQILFDVVEEYSKSASPSDAFGLRDIRFVNNDIKTARVFRKEFRARYGHGVPECKGDVAVSTNLSASHSANTLKRGSLLPVGSRTCRKGSNPSTVDTTTKISKPNKSKKPSPEEKASERESLSRKHSRDDLRPRHQPTTEEKRKQPHSRDHAGVKSSFSGGARPKQLSTQGSKKKEKLELQSTSSSSTTMRDEPPKCPICLGKIKYPRTLPKCKHTFCKTCLEMALQEAPWCPYCKEPLPDRSSSPSQDTNGYQQGRFGFPAGPDPYENQLPNLIFFGQQFGLHASSAPDYHRTPRRNQRGDQTFSSFSFDRYQEDQFGVPHNRTAGSRMQRGSQPDGSMMVRNEQFGLPGYEQYRTIVIQYSFTGGRQGPDHPNPGQTYNGTHRSAYLPDCPEGREVLKLLRKAFDAGLVFKIGRSMTSNMDNQIIWADIPHKTCTRGGPTKYGYPDPTYLADVKQQLQAALTGEFL